MEIIMKKTLYIPIKSIIALSLIVGCTYKSNAMQAPSQNTWYDTRIKNRGVVYFYEKGKPYYEFTNFFEPKSPVKIDGFDWPTTEQYYQAGKFTENSIRDLIRRGSNQSWKDRKPSHKSWGAWAFYIANEAPEIKNKAQQRQDWFTAIPGLGMQRNINRMLVALRAKFNQDPHLRKLLLNTYPQVLVEDSPGDGYFGTGNPNKNIPLGTGQNLLGRMLMHVRKEIYRKDVLGNPNPETPFNTNTDFTLDYLLSGAKI